MATINVGEKEFETLITESPIVFVDFWAEWCGPCKMFGPVFEAASEKHPDVVFAKVDTEAEQELAAHFQIRSIPTIMVVRQQVVLMSQAGMLPEEALRDVIGKAQELDMDDVRRQIAEAKEQEAAG